MANTKNILVGTDLSEFSRRAEKRAAMLCADLEYDWIELLTVREGGLPEALALVLRKTPTETKALLTERAMRRTLPGRWKRRINQFPRAPIQTQFPMLQIG